VQGEDSAVTLRQERYGFVQPAVAVAFGRASGRLCAPIDERIAPGTERRVERERCLGENRETSPA